MNLILPDELEADTSDSDLIAAVQDAQSRLEAYWGDLHREQDKDHQVFAKELVVTVPKNYNVVYPGTGNTIVEVAADHIAGDDPLVKVPLLTEHQGAKDLSEKQEKWAQGALYRFRQQDVMDPVRAIIINLCWAGQVVSQGPLYDPEAWPDDPTLQATTMPKGEYDEAMARYDSEKKQRWPFIWRLIDPRYVFADPGTHGRKYVIVSYMRNVGEIRATWPNWDGKKPNSSERYKDTEEVRFTEYWDPTWKVYIALRDLLERTEHGYGKVPIQIKSAGLGERSGRPHEVYRSLLWAGRGMIEQEIAVASQLDAVMRNAAWTMMMTPEGSRFRQLEPGKTVRMQPEHIDHTRPVTELRPEVVQALLNESAWVDNKIQDATYPSIVRGLRAPGGPTSGYGVNSQAALAKIKFGSIAKAAEEALSEFFADLFVCVRDVVKEPVPVLGPTKSHGIVDLVLKPSEVKGRPYVQVKLNPKLPTDRANEVQLGIMLKTNGAIDDDTFMEEYAGIEQPEEMRVRIMADKLRQSPLVDSVLQLAAAEEIGMVDWLREKGATFGFDPDVVIQQLVQKVFAAQQPPAPPGQVPGQPPPGGGGGPGNPMNGAGAGTPDLSMFPTAQTQPQPGGPGEMFNQTSAARGAGVPPMRAYRGQRGGG